MHRRGNVMGTPRFACWLARAAARCCSAASPFSLTRAGELTGGIRGIQAFAELPFTSVASTEDSNLFAALDTVPKPANIGDPNPLTIRDIKRDGKSTVLVDVVSPEAKEVSLFVEGPTPDWSLPVPELLN